MDTYSKEIRAPSSAVEGFQNHIQMAINEIERGNLRDAVLTLVDLIDSLYGEGSRVDALKKIFFIEADESAKKNVGVLYREAIQQPYQKGFFEGKKAGVNLVFANVKKAIETELFNK